MNVSMFILCRNHFSQFYSASFSEVVYFKFFSYLQKTQVAAKCSILKVQTCSVKKLSIMLLASSLNLTILRPSFPNTPRKVFIWSDMARKSFKR